MSRGKQTKVKGDGIFNGHITEEGHVPVIAGFYYHKDAVEYLQLKSERNALFEALHEIYGQACIAMGEDDDLLLYQFAQEARDIALKAALESSDE